MKRSIALGDLVKKLEGPLSSNEITRKEWGIVKNAQGNALELVLLVALERMLVVTTVGVLGRLNGWGEITLGSSGLVDSEIPRATARLRSISIALARASRIISLDLGCGSAVFEGVVTPAFLTIFEASQSESLGLAVRSALLDGHRRVREVSSPQSACRLGLGQAALELPCRSGRCGARRGSGGLGGSSSCLGGGGRCLDRRCRCCGSGGFGGRGRGLRCGGGAGVGGGSGLGEKSDVSVAATVLVGCGMKGAMAG